MEKILLTPREAAEITGMSINTIQKLCKEDFGFPSFKVGRDNKIGRASLEEWVARKCCEKASIATDCRKLVDLSKRVTTGMESKRYKAK